MIWFSYDTCDRFLILFCIISYQCIYYIRIILFWYKNCIWQNLIWVKGNFIWIWELTMRIDFCGFCVGPMNAEEVDPRLLIPVCDRLCCYLPWSVRRHFYCGAEYQTEVSTAHMYMWYVSCTGGTQNVPFFQPHSLCTSRTPKFPEYDNLYSILKFSLNAAIILYRFLYCFLMGSVQVFFSPKFQFFYPEKFCGLQLILNLKRSVKLCKTRSEHFVIFMENSILYKFVSGK